MKNWILLSFLASLIGTQVIVAQPQLIDCSCLATQVVRTTNACQAVVPDMCQFTNCFMNSAAVPPMPLTCSQSPPAGTIVGPGTYAITVTAMDNQGLSAQCLVAFTVNSPATGPFGLVCAANKTVECGTTWTFNAPTPTNACCPHPGTPNGGVTITELSTVTNGTCPEVITRTWNGVDDCGASSTCSQTVTVVDTTPPILDCNCLKNPVLIQLTVTACSNAIPDLCLLIGSCATDNCGPLHCSQTPAAGTIVYPGTHPITVTVTDCASNSASCVIAFTVNPPPGGCNPCPPETRVWNSGMGGPSGNVMLPAGTPDPNYTLVSLPPGGCTGPAQVLNPSTLPVGPWIANGPNSQWIGGGPTANCQGGVYHYRICFYLACTDGAAVIGRWTADDWAEIFLNGQPTGHTVPSTQFPNNSFDTFHPVSITNGFVCGNNCLDIYVTNAYTFDNPTGFRAELTNVFNECCCQPAQTLFSVLSGRNSAGMLAPGTPDGQFALTCAPPGVTATTPVVIDPLFIPSIWVPNGPNSQWIGPDQFNNAPAGTYCYTFNFNIPCPPGVPIKASLTGQWTADDTGAISLNGQPASTNLPAGWAFTNWHGINITNGFVPGLNSLTFYVTNSGGPSGLRLELTGFASCCGCTNTNCVVSITCPPDRDIQICGTQGHIIYPQPTASSTCGIITNLTCAPPSNTVFPLGTNTVTCTARDANGNSASCSFLVILRPDTTPPTCPPLNMTVTGCPPRMPNFATNGLVTDNCTPSGQITVTQSIPPGTALPPGQTVVILHVCDAAGNCRDCDVIITGVLGGPPPAIHCPPNLTLLTCTNKATAYYKVTAIGHHGPIVCTPPSGTIFMLGTNVVTCTATNNCGGSASCSFLVIVKSQLTVNPTVTITAGLPDNFALPVEPSPQNACMVSAFSGYPFWKGFDSNAANNLFGHRFTGLPNNIVKAELIIHMKPSADSGSDNDGLFIGLGSSCTFTSFLYGQSIKLLPGAVPATGGTWIQPSNGPTTFTLDLGGLNAGFISKLNTNQFLDVVVHDDTTVDYMRLRLWQCPPPRIGIGIPYELTGGATAALRPAVPGLEIVGPALCVFPNPALPSGVLLQPGAPQAVTFTTVLDFEAPEGAVLDVGLPPDAANPGGLPLLSFRSKGKKGYCVKSATKYTDDPAAQYRSIAIGTNGELFSSFKWDETAMDTNVLLNLNHLPGVTSVVMTVELDCLTREVSIAFPFCIWTPDNARKGWDGCIYGNGTPSKGLKTNKTARLILTPLTTVVSPPITEVALTATALPEILVDDPTVTSMGRKWGDGHVTLMKAYDDGEEARKIEFTSYGEGGGVHVDLGRTESFTIGLHHFENGDLPTEEQLTRTIGPIRGLTNRPPPPFLDAMVLKRVGLEIACSADFSGLESPTVSIFIYHEGALVTHRSGVPAQLGETLFTIEDWPITLGKIGGRSPCRTGTIKVGTIRFPGGGGLAPASTGETYLGDEFRILAEMPEEAPRPDYYSAFEIFTSEGMESLAYNLQRTVACPPAALQINRSSDGVVLDWTAEGYGVQGAETVDGPWFDLGVTSPVAVGATAPHRFFRLVCE